jgi:hypothetical protein
LGGLGGMAAQTTWQRNGFGIDYLIIVSGRFSWFQEWADSLFLK